MTNATELIGTGLVMWLAVMVFVVRYVRVLGSAWRDVLMYVAMYLTTVSLIRLASLYGYMGGFEEARVLNGPLAGVYAAAILLSCVEQIIRIRMGCPKDDPA